MSSLKLGSNISSLKAQGELSQTTSKLSKTFERLSSGLRINSASDDAAGLAISESLKSDNKVFLQGVRNINDGISLLNIADQAVGELTEIVTRLKELAEQSSNGTYTKVQREALDDEAQALSTEYLRIAKSTQFNDKNLFTGTFGELRLQGGYGTSGGFSSGLGGVMGTGSFSSGTSYLSNPTTTNSVTVADVNGDGNVDLVTVGSTSPNTEIRLGTGGGTFGAATSYLMGGTDIELADLNNDGVLDLVSSGGATRLGNGDGTFGTFNTHPGTLSTVTEVTLSDINDDGFLDYIGLGVDSSADPTLFIGYGTGSGTFSGFISVQVAAHAAGGAVDISSGDFNGDGKLDLAIAANDTSSNARVYTMFGTGSTFSNVSTLLSVNAVTANATSVETRDINNDGKLDIVATGNTSAGFTNVFLGNGNGTFGSAVSYAAETTTNSVHLADFNGDGYLDLVTAGQTSSAGINTIRLNNGDGSFGAAVTYSAEATTSKDIISGDFNNDGVLDLVSVGNDAATDGYSTVRLGATREGIGPILPFSLGTAADARQAFSAFENKLDQLYIQRGTIGAFMSRAEVAVNVLQSAADNYSMAASRITDADIAQETADMVRLQILQKSSAAVLAQANQQPELVLKLLDSK